MELSSITRENILNAMDRFNREGVGKYTVSNTYDVLFDGKRYPPLVLIKYALEVVNNTDSIDYEIRGGFGTESFKILRKLGFRIVEKEASKITAIVSEFLNRGYNGILKKSDLVDKKNYLRLDYALEVGSPTKVPVMAYLDEAQKISNGIYVAYLYYKNYNKLFLCFAYSTDNIPKCTWTDIDNYDSCGDYLLKEFPNSNLLNSEKYYKDVKYFKVYDVVTDPHPVLNETEEQLHSDLEEILAMYHDEMNKHLFSGKVENIPEHQMPDETENNFKYGSFVKQIKDAGFYFEDDTVLRFIALLLTKPFVILTGLSGSGKTKLAQSFAKWITASDSHYKIVPIGPDWSNRDNLLGYPNPLSSDTYNFPESGSLNVILSAIDNPNLPHFLILDEMNLSHVEKYFADFLSALESGEVISLHKNDNIRYPPKDIQLPKNLFIVGTVNIDETTYMFSPKVLDRAGVIEFRVDEKDLEQILSSSQIPTMEKIEKTEKTNSEIFIKLSQKRFENSKIIEELKDPILELFKLLKVIGSEFGFRTIIDIKRYAEVVLVLGTEVSPQFILDTAILQKLLPKLHGSRKKIEPTLDELLKFCKKGEGDSLYPLSYAKLTRMKELVKSNGFVSFSEA